MKYKYGDFHTESTLYMYSIRKVIMYNCHLAWLFGAIQRMLFSNIQWKVLYPAEKEEAWNFKTSFKRRQWQLLVWINRGMIEKARQDLETNIRSSDKSEYTIEAEAYISGHRYKIYTTRRAWRHTFTKSDRRWKGLSTDVKECWPFVYSFCTQIWPPEINNNIWSSLFL